MNVIDRSLLHDDVMRAAAAVLNEQVWRREMARREQLDRLYRIRTIDEFEARALRKMIDAAMEAP